VALFFIKLHCSASDPYHLPDSAELVAGSALASIPSHLRVSAFICVLPIGLAFRAEVAVQSLHGLNRPVVSRRIRRSTARVTPPAASAPAAHLKSPAFASLQNLHHQ
jgi:hypothetical protein